MLRESSQLWDTKQDKMMLPWFQNVVLGLFHGSMTIINRQVVLLSDGLQQTRTWPLRGSLCKVKVIIRRFTKNKSNYTESHIQ